jgi:hypothetical protein
MSDEPRTEDEIAEWRNWPMIFGLVLSILIAYLAS